MTHDAKDQDAAIRAYLSKIPDSRPTGFARNFTQWGKRIDYERKDKPEAD